MLLFLVRRPVRTIPATFLQRSGTRLIPYNFTHRVDFVGGYGDATYATSSAFKLFSGSFSTPGTKTVRDTLSCSCGSIFLAQAEETIEVCETSKVTPYSPDPGPLDTGSLTQATRTALACLQRAVSEAGGTLYVISGYRSQSYQDHLLEVWDKYQIVKDWPSGQCSEIRRNVEGEWNRHLLGYRPADVSPHTAGNAFDASWSMLPQNVSIDTLAASCDLSRPLKSADPYH